MKKYNAELAVGIFVLVGLICIGYLTFKLGKMEFFSQNGYTITASFHSASGLRGGANIEMAGVSVGKVTSISLNPKTQSDAIVAMRMNPEIKISHDAVASIKTSGLIGDKYINISQGNSAKFFTDNEEMNKTESVVDIESTIKNFFGGGNLDLVADTGYLLYAKFTSAAGLNSGANVQIAGVPVGKVIDIALSPDSNFQAIATIRLLPEIQISDDSIASIKSSGLIGGKYINLSPGGSGKLLANNDEITETESSVDLESLISKYVFGGVK